MDPAFTDYPALLARARYVDRAVRSGRDPLVGKSSSSAAAAAGAVVSFVPVPPASRRRSAVETAVAAVPAARRLSPRAVAFVPSILVPVVVVPVRLLIPIPPVVTPVVTPVSAVGGTPVAVAVAEHDAGDAFAWSKFPLSRGDASRDPVRLLPLRDDVVHPRDGRRDVAAGDAARPVVPVDV